MWEARGEACFGEERSAGSTASSSQAVQPLLVERAPESVSCALFLCCFQLNRILVPEWHVLGCMLSTLYFVFYHNERKVLLSKLHKDFWIHAEKGGKIGNIS